MPVIAVKYAVTATPILIGSGRGADNVTLVIRGASATVFLGGPLVDATNGLPLNTGESLTLDLFQGDSLYAVTATTATLNVLQTRG